MPTNEYNTDECTNIVDASQHPELYKTYVKWQICLSLLSMLFCIAFVAGITYVTVTMGYKWMVFLYVMPTLCYIAANES